ncbi:helix-turn-helix transcriptional regulator [Myroides pelagicus]|uniref:helix-turn-helix domain-containing protein n=1 Tax=Myroides pelagicus TaxID=270914 RepID=UPI002DBC5455|nr:helix-turn-helix transcriptional regulator [Myroides pelagicus]MEC4114927.1 helix-turn-helix transcriptional regulator [Myroides pelagicus]
MLVRKIIGKKLSSIREELNYTQVDIADLLGVDVSRVKNLELGNAKNIDFYDDYAELLGCTIELKEGVQAGLLKLPTFSLTKQIRLLIGSAYFNKPKTSAEILAKLVEVDGVRDSVDTAQVANVLLTLEKKGEINVERSNKIHKYYK